MVQAHAAATSLRAEYQPVAAVATAMAATAPRSPTLKKKKVA